jgi:hypothetical protein
MTPHRPGQRGGIKVKNHGYWRRDHEIDSLHRSLERRAAAYWPSRSSTASEARSEARDVAEGQRPLIAAAAYGRRLRRLTWRAVRVVVAHRATALFVSRLWSRCNAVGAAAASKETSGARTHHHAAQQGDAEWLGVASGQAEARFMFVAVCAKVVVDQ